MPELISVAEAKQYLIQHLPLSQGEWIPLAEGLGRILQEEVLSPVDHPIFDQTAVDGYALHAEDLAIGSKVVVSQVIQAGHYSTQAVKKGHAARIFTGAPVPPDTAAVVMQEHVQVEKDGVQILDQHLRPGNNIRKSGEQIRRGMVALQKGEKLNASSLGFLASIGIEKVHVARIPKVDVLVTGNEFAQSLDEWEQGKIFESNGLMLSAALNGIGISAKSEAIRDDLETLTQRIASFDGDILLVTGGVSVGDFDFTRPALEQAGYEVVFHKVNQKPGKPLLFARKGHQYAFGLPGNPRSVMVGWHEYVRPFLLGFMGGEDIFPPSLRVPSIHPIRNKPGKTTFLAARVEPGGVEVLDLQASHMLQSLSRAHCWVVLHPDRGDIATGDWVDIHWIV